MAAGTGLPPALLKYWSRAGEGGAKIQWGVAGDFDRCRVLVNEAIVKGGKKPLSDNVISGLCSTLHVINTGARPGHAAGESSGKA
jgi:hypothetical protein